MSKNDNDYFQLSDEAIAQIAKLIQVAILSGTDIVDHMRLVQFTNVGNKLYVEEEYLKRFEENIDQMLKELKDNAE